MKSDFWMNYSHESILLVNQNSLNCSVIVIAVSFLFGPGLRGGLGLAGPHMLRNGPGMKAEVCLLGFGTEPLPWMRYFSYSREKKYLIPCWFCTFAHWQRNDQSIILMVGLFEQWETKQIQKNAFQKSYKLICILMSQISIWSPINQQYFWLPGVFLQVRSWD